MHEKSLTTLPIPGLIRSIAIPASVGFFFNTMYNVVDTWFAGLIGTEAQAALSLALPVFFIIIAVGSGIQTGSMALIGGALGAKKNDEARLFVVQTVSFGLVSSVLLGFFGIRFAPVLFGIMGAHGPYLDTCMAYMTPIFMGAPAFLLVFMFNATLQATGDTRTMRNFLIAGAVLNCVLDPWFIFGGLGVPAMGVSGVAWATVVIQCIGSAYLLYKARRTGLLCTARGRNLIPRPTLFLDIARQGFPATLNFLTIGMGMFVVNAFISDFGQQAVAAYGVAMRVEQVAFMPGIGLNVAALSIVAQNHGAGNVDRIRETMLTCIKYGAWVMLPVAVPVIAFARPLMNIFTADQTVADMGAAYLRIDALIFLGYIIIFVCTSALQGMKRPAFAVWLGLWRQFAAPILFFWVCTDLLHLGLTSVWWSIFAITWSSAAIAYRYADTNIKRLGA
ncbi:MATE family efflux transporter [Pseudodesulfovibrio senegalensis]|uniref:MATE family efflux transporter n=1 Tax=Pseudodesulfovibrio senegalensis TaxID=1721087 RepID=A0A6N6MZE3_9BACT|nr:MATE family efflux transporter [Pseudodesulfovibrio senegalensis]KAB1438969.1 MATE family efflux transporter [Pseudodesulfovibrio senegalensis]